MNTAFNVTTNNMFNISIDNSELSYDDIVRKIINSEGDIFNTLTDHDDTSTSNYLIEILTFLSKSGFIKVLIHMNPNTVFDYGEPESIKLYVETLDEVSGETNRVFDLPSIIGDHPLLSELPFTFIPIETVLQLKVRIESFNCFIRYIGVYLGRRRDFHEDSRIPDLDNKRITPRIEFRRYGLTTLDDDSVCISRYEVPYNKPNYYYKYNSIEYFIYKLYTTSKFLHNEVIMDHSMFKLDTLYLLAENIKNSATDNTLILSDFDNARKGVFIELSVVRVKGTPTESGDSMSCDQIFVKAKYGVKDIYKTCYSFFYITDADSRFYRDFSDIIKIDQPEMYMNHSDYPLLYDILGIVNKQPLNMNGYNNIRKQSIIFDKLYFKDTMSILESFVLKHSQALTRDNLVATASFEKSPELLELEYLTRLENELLRILLTCRFNKRVFDVFVDETDISFEVLLIYKPLEVSFWYKFDIFKINIGVFGHNDFKHEEYNSLIKTNPIIALMNMDYILDNHKNIESIKSTIDVMSLQRFSMEPYGEMYVLKAFDDALYSVIGMDITKPSLYIFITNIVTGKLELTRIIDFTTFNEIASLYKTHYAAVFNNPEITLVDSLKILEL